MPVISTFRSGEIENDFLTGVGLRGAVRMGARRLLVLVAVFFLGAADVLRAVLVDRTLFVAVLGAVFLALGFVLALVAIFPPTAANLQAIIALMFLAVYGGKIHIVRGQ